MNPSPEPSTTSSDIPTSAFIGTDVSLLPTPGFSGSINGSDIWAYKYAKGTRLDCFLYANGTDFGSSASCDDVAKAAGVTTANLTAWNPSLKGTSCTLDGSLTYCVQPMEFNATQQTEYCAMSAAPAYGLDCPNFLAVWGINMTDFASWNPGVGSTCENWVNGEQILDAYDVLRTEDI